ncbi:hypothetical protein D9M68_18060 [compost metagenome]
MEANATVTPPMTPNDFTIRQMRAAACLNALQLMAMRKQTINYETLALMLGLPSSGNALASAISPVLYDVYNFCVEVDMPHLTILVVRKSGRDKGLPGPGFWKVYGEHFLDSDFSFNDRVEITERETAKCFELFSKLGA